MSIVVDISLVLVGVLIGWNLRTFRRSRTSTPQEVCKLWFERAHAMGHRVEWFEERGVGEGPHWETLCPGKTCWLLKERP